MRGKYCIPVKSEGAAIGALAGGGGGLIYDRATHEKRLVTER